MKVLVLAGGDFSEREVSFDSGKAICESLVRLGHEVTALDPANGQSLLSHDGAFISSIPISKSSVENTTHPVSNALAKFVTSDEAGEADVVFLGLHGGSGENGTVQCLLDLAGMKYTGSSMRASTIAMDKAVSKQLFRSVGIPTPEWMTVADANKCDPSQLSAQINERFQMPVIVKPNESGSTVALTLVRNLSDLENAILKAARERGAVMVEQYIAGREMTVAVLDGVPMPVVEIKPTNELYDYEAKYTKGKSEYLVPAPVSSSVSDALKQAALKMYNVVGASGLARADFMLTDADQLFALEINTLPGMTELSLAPMAAREAGLEFDQLVERLLQGAIARR